MTKLWMNMMKVILRPNQEDSALRMWQRQTFQNTSVVFHLSRTWLPRTQDQHWFFKPISVVHSSSLEEDYQAEASRGDHQQTGGETQRIDADELFWRGWVEYQFLELWIDSSFSSHSVFIVLFTRRLEHSDSQPQSLSILLFFVLFGSVFFTYYKNTFEIEKSSSYVPFSSLYG